MRFLTPTLLAAASLTTTAVHGHVIQHIRTRETSPSFTITDAIHKGITDLAAACAYNVTTPEISADPVQPGDYASALFTGVVKDNTTIPTKGVATSLTLLIYACNMSPTNATMQCNGDGIKKAFQNYTVPTVSEVPSDGILSWKLDDRDWRYGVRTLRFEDLVFVDLCARNGTGDGSNQ